MDKTAYTVFIVNGGWDSRLMLSRELTIAGYHVRSFRSAEGYLAAQNAEIPGCVLLDVVLPGMSGLDLQSSLLGSPSARPIIFLTDQGDIGTGVQAMKAGAIDFLTRPVGNARLFGAIDQALQRDLQERLERSIRSVVKSRLETLTHRERQVMTYVIQGRLNKQIAAGLGTCEKTVKVHRARVMSKMGARSVPELVRLGASIGAALEPTMAVNSNTLCWRLTPDAEQWRRHSPALPRAKPDVVVLMTNRVKKFNQVARRLGGPKRAEYVGVSAAR